ncbi:DUF4974 domain-containing protein [Flammeovirgaceae bacterium SG7u.111]|nr:DUF4974 domain-containing protein [Flammeovirgaceae bacterium SG7u.132]WPO37610.1 DUF4974 domain-containing protein [Flammeovirgaceae bacterium SG7u.111]
MKTEEYQIWKYLNNQATEKESIAIIKWMKDPANKDAVEKIMDKNWDTEPSTSTIPPINSETTFRKIKASIKKGASPFQVSYKKTNYPVWKYMVAASLALLVWAGINLYQKNQSTEEMQQSATVFKEKQNTAGRKSILTLPDKTKIWLNAESTLRYPTQFSDDERVVYLTGEAYFDVARDTTRPFRVVTGNISTTALGTSFNIKAFPQSQAIEVALTSGKVVVNSSNNKKKTTKNKVFLVPGENAIYHKKEAEIEKGLFDANTIAWKDGTLFFKKADLEEITETLARWYGVTFEVKRKVKISYNGSFKNKSLERVLDGISLATGIKYTMEDNFITIY